MHHNNLENVLLQKKKKSSLWRTEREILTRLLVSVRNLVQVEEILKLDDKAKRL